MSLNDDAIDKIAFKIEGNWWNEELKILYISIENITNEPITTSINVECKYYY